MASASEILDQIASSIQDHIDSFNSGIPAIEKQIYGKVLELIKDLEIKNGRIANSVANLNRIGKLKQEIQNLILNKKYLKDAKEFQKAYDAVHVLQQSYFSSLSVEIGRSKLLDTIKNDAVNYTAQQLTEAGINQKVMPGIEQILRANITGGGSVADFTEQMRTYLTTTTDETGKKTLGALQRHTRQITTDSLNTFSRNYNDTVSQDLGWKWLMYTGSLLATSREWCRRMVKKKYIHESELHTVIFDHIDGVKICSDEIPCSKSTGLPQGMIKGTDENNVISRAGGFQCGHQFGRVPDSVVPLSIRQKFKQQ